MASILKTKLNQMLKTLLDGLYWVLLIILTVVTISLVFQQIMHPDKIPHVFGYKIFIIMDEYMTDELKKGDLAITKNIDKEVYQTQDSMAFRNRAGFVTIHQIQDIFERNDQLYFQMKALESETTDTKYVNESNIEGKLVKRIPLVGLILLYVQMPQVMAGVILFIMLCGAVALKIARHLDERDFKKEQAQLKNTLLI